ncbi:putative thiamine biosynthesis oxidoreductase ThiO [Pilimelia terevasa]|uniref:glycine oxidase n=1 Tax=Pilimelia terevasa TaxID=53372 RepID=A0A8J3FFR4_9ACTN|nr:glycine oxidase ThiO [Pilimelia terevasa]GGK13931.1 putative thiamine biosynthesis oxidoreductase ThiO [Pilimelia terevasa]
MRVAVVGAGPVGLAAAWRCAARGHEVRVYGDGGDGAWRVAAGMLAPVAEAYFGERALTALLVAGAAAWPDFATTLGGADRGAADLLGYRVDGTLMVGWTSDDLAEVARLRAYQEELGLPVEALRGAGVRAREPLLSPRVRGGAHAPGDHAVDPRRLVGALRAAAVAAGAVCDPSRVADLAALSADAVVVAAGLGVAALTGLPVRPVKGQVLRLRTPDGGPPGFRHVVRGVVDGRRVYCVPRPDGEVVVGATVEERGDDVATAGAALDLLRAAVDLIPDLAEYALAEVGVGHRAGTPDNGPILGRLDARVVVAGGFHRHGVVLAPLAGTAAADLVDGRAPAAVWAPFTPQRFGKG